MALFRRSLYLLGLGMLVARMTGGAEAAPAGAGSIMAQGTATGGFEVRLTPGSTQDASIGAMAISKTFTGDIQGTSSGEMLAVRTPVDNSAGYVAMERVTATIAGRHGTFALQHSGTMDKGVQSASVTVVPDSGTGGLAGMSGFMVIRMEAGQHNYVLHYALPQ